MQGCPVTQDGESQRLEVCVAGEAAWLTAAHAALGAPWRVGNGIAWAPSGPAHRFLLGAITLAPRPRLPKPLAGTVRDSWASLAGEMPAGWQPVQGDPWMFRYPGRCSARAVAGMTITRTRDSLLFEETAFIAASGVGPARAGELHPRGSENIAGLHMFLATLNKRPVGTALALAHRSGVIISAVAVMADHRRLGIGAALTSAAANVAPAQPATLTASAAAYETYRRLGFKAAGHPTDWRRN